MYSDKYLRDMILQIPITIVSLKKTVPKKQFSMFFHLAGCGRIYPLCPSVDGNAEPDAS
jgi:hypothetical protein